MRAAARGDWRRLSEPQVPKQHDHEAWGVKRRQNHGLSFLLVAVMGYLWKGMSIVVIVGARIGKTESACSNQQGGGV